MKNFLHYTQPRKNYTQPHSAYTFFKGGGIKL